MKKKLLTYYIVIDKNKDFKDTKYYTICQSKADCEEFIDNYLIFLNAEHYVSWCEVRKLNPDAIESWNEYKIALDLTDKFTIIKVKNTLNNVLSIVRKSMHCPLMNCSYETDYERR